jgi:class 3 adenylate cyclase
VSLIELMVVLSVMSVVMLTAAMTIGTLMRAEGRGATALSESLAVSEFADRLREDVHAASEAALDDAGRLVLAMGDTRVQYEIAGMRLLRTAGADEPTKRDAFRLPAEHARFEVSPERKIVTLRIGGGPRDAKTPAPPGAARVLQIQALVARNKGGGGQ